MINKHAFIYLLSIKNQSIYYKQITIYLSNHLKILKNIHILPVLFTKLWYY